MQRPRLLLPVSLSFLLWAPILLAYPSQVREMLQHAPQYAVIRAPNTISDLTKKQLEVAASLTAQRTGGKVYFVIDNKTQPSEYNALYTDLGLTGHDILIASNGPGWSLQCGSLQAQQKQDILNRAGLAGGAPSDRLVQIAEDAGKALAVARPSGHRMDWNEFQHANRDRGLTPAQMADAYARYKEHGTHTGLATTAQPQPDRAGGHGGLIFLGVVVALLVGVVLWRRRRRDANIAAEWATAIAAPGQVLTAVYLDLDGMEKLPQFPQLMDQITAVQTKLDQLKGQAPSREGIARAQGLTDEANRVRLAFAEARRQLA